jgi:hypothetical protein
VLDLLLVATSMSLQGSGALESLYILKQVCLVCSHAYTYCMFCPLKVKNPPEMGSRRRRGKEEQCKSKEEPCKGLIPALPDELALLCLARVPRAQHAVLSAVCRSWRRLLQSRVLYDIRQELSVTEEWLFLWTQVNPISSFCVVCNLVLNLRSQRHHKVQNSCLNFTWKW